MKKNLRILAMILSLAMVFSLAACGAEKQPAVSEPAAEKPAEAEVAVEAEAEPEAAFPSKTITIVVPFGAGGGTDSCTRLMANAASEIFNVPIVVSNQAGGSTIPAVEEFFEAEPDGYTLFAMTGTTVSAAAYNMTEWNPIDDFKPVARMTNEPQFIFLHDPADGGRFGTIEELIEYAKQNPGDVTIASTGAGSGPSFLIQNMMQDTGTVITEVVFDGTSTASAAVAGGHVDACIMAASGVVALMDAGNLKMACCVGTERDPNYPDIPTAIELGYNFINTSFWGIVAPKDTPDEVVKTLTEVFSQALEAPSTTSMAGKLGYALNYADPEGFGSDIKNLFERYLAAMQG